MSNSALKQPAGLPVLFFAELWERFGFYCVQSLLVLYLTQKLLWSDKPSYDLFSAFSALIYATPVIGGFLADKLLGYRRAILLGAVLYIIGYFSMGSSDPLVFNFALAALICGNGFFKPNVSSLLGKLYNEDDPRRDSGFTWFYMGINIGSFLAPVICAYIAYKWGWHYAFMSAGVGMVISLLICLLGFNKLGDKGYAPVKMGILSKVLFYGLVAGFLYCIAILLQHDKLVSNVLIGIGVIAFVILFISAFFEDSAHRKRLFALIILMLFSIIFWALFVQMFSSLTLFTERNINREIFGQVIPTGMFTSTEPFFIIVLAPLFAMLWMKLGGSHSRLNPSTAMKFALAIIFVGIGFLSLVLGMKLAGIVGLVSAGWLIFNYFMTTLGELSLSPIGLSAVTSLAPPKLVGMVMGIWFLALSVAYALGGKLANLTAIPKGSEDPAMSGHIYFTNFLHFGLVSVGIGIVLIFLSPVLNKMMSHA